MEAVTVWIQSQAANGNHFIRYGSYSRKTPPEIPLAICRVQSPEGDTHALIPCFIIAYDRVKSYIKELVNRKICYEEATIEQLAELFNVEPITISRWWKQFKSQIDGLLAWLAKQLADTNQTTDWISGKYDSERVKGRKVFELLNRYARGFPGFPYDNFALVNLMDSSLFSKSQ
jgi:hypothetical protein